MRSNPNNDQKRLLIAELKKAAIKHTPENIIAIPIVVRYRVLGFEESGVRSQESGFGIQESGFGIQDSGFRS